MTSELLLEVVTPFGQAYSAPVSSCVIPGEQGQFQILKDHAAMVSLVTIGAVKIEKTDGTSEYMAVSGGYCEVRDNKVKLIVEAAEMAREIDVQRAEAAKKRAEERLQARAENIDFARAQMALARAVNRLKVAQLQ